MKGDLVLRSIIWASIKIRKFYDEIKADMKGKK